MNEKMENNSESSEEQESKLEIVKSELEEVVSSIAKQEFKLEKIKSNLKSIELRLEKQELELEEQIIMYRGQKLMTEEQATLERSILKLKGRETKLQRQKIMLEKPVIITNKNEELKIEEVPEYQRLMLEEIKLKLKGEKPKLKERKLRLKKIQLILQDPELDVARQKFIIEEQKKLLKQITQSQKHIMTLEIQKKRLLRKLGLIPEKQELINEKINENIDNKNNLTKKNNLIERLMNLIETKMSWIKKLMFGSLSILLIIAFNSCDSKKDDIQHDSRSLEQIYRDEGVPVRIVEIASKSLSSDMAFLATMLGIQETTINSKIADKIVSIPVKVGSRIKAGQILATFPTDNTQLQWEQAKTAYENSKRTWERMKNLLASGDVSQATYDGAETQYLVAKQTFESLKQMVELDAPFSGVVTNIAVKVGDKVNVNVPLITIAQTGTMIARIWASETEVRRLKVGMPASIVIDGNEFTGKIATVSLSMDPLRKAFQVDVHFNNSKGQIKSGTTTDLAFKFGDNIQSIIIPRRFIRINGDEQYVFVADVGNNIAKKVLVKTGQVSGVNITIEEGLKLDDKIITEGASLLEDGMKIRIIE